jgi:hypothetical protein
VVDDAGVADVAAGAPPGSTAVSVVISSA